jgi:hypothetical protein
LNGEFKFLGEFGGSLVMGASGQRGFGSSGSFNRGSNFNSISGLSGSDKYSILANFGSSI